MKTEQEIKRAYDMFTPEDLKELHYTGDWEKDKKRFTIEYKKNQELKL